MKIKRIKMIRPWNERLYSWFENISELLKEKCGFRYLEDKTDNIKMDAKASGVGSFRLQARGHLLKHCKRML
jgi:hypothetical protein